MDADLLIRGATVVDGSGPTFVGDVAVAAGVIAAVGHGQRGLAIEHAGTIVDADGLLLCPGFIDMHAHSAFRPFSNPRETAKIGQGFTTEVILPDGLGPAPVAPERVQARRAYLAGLEGHGPQQWDWTTLDGYLHALAGQSLSTDMVACVPHSAVREFAMGSANRAPDPTEIAVMRNVVAASFEAGARALSFGLIYAPGLYADTAELTALAEVAASYGAPLVPHVRNEAAGLLDSVREFIEVAEATGAPLHLSHLKLIGSPDLLPGVLELLAEAGNRIDLTYDQYPYGAGNTLLSALLPPWVFDRGPDVLLERLADADQVRLVRSDLKQGLPGWENLLGACGADGIVITDAGAERPDAVGRSLAEIASDTGTDPVGALVALLRDTRLDSSMIDHYASEETVRTLFGVPNGTVGSDGIFGAKPHPRLHGTAARVLGRFALQDKLVPVEEAVARLTSRAADRLRLTDRGRIASGYKADLVLLDPSELMDNATYEDPTRSPSGVREVFVRGEAVYRDGAHTGNFPGQVLRTAAR